LGLLDSDAEEPQSKVLRWAVTGLLLVVLSGLTAWYFLRYQTEKNTARHFFEALAAGDTKKAFELWMPGPSYSYELFLEDWGPTGEYGPVRSFRIVGADRPKNASGVVIVVEVSPQSPFDGSAPGVKEVRIWVERKDQSLGFPP
jgi:hypothetical protein